MAPPSEGPPERCRGYLLQVRAGVRLGRQPEELLLVLLLELRQLAVLLQEDVLKGLDLRTSTGSTQTICLSDSVLI